MNALYAMLASLGESCMVISGSHFGECREDLLHVSDTPHQLPGAGSVGKNVRFAGLGHGQRSVVCSSRSARVRDG